MKIKAFPKVTFFIILFFIILFLLSTAIFSYFSYYKDNSSGEKILVFLYHDLRSGKLKSSDNPAYCTTAKKFQEDITVLLDAGYTPLNLYRYYTGDFDVRNRYFILTFDDGYLSNYTVAYPILKKYGVYADIFVCTGMMEKSNHFNLAQGKIMEDSGLITLYGHTISHTSAMSTFPENYSRIVKGSQIFLNMRMKRDRLFFFAYPYGHCDAETARALTEAGVQLQLAQSPPSGYDPSDNTLLIRHTVSYDTDMNEFLSSFFERST